ncbi:MAG: 3-oxoacyl-ACP synthase III family protein [Acidimicrobiales bacterium]
MRNTWLMMEKSPDGESSPFTARFESIGRRLPETRLSSEDLMATVRHRTKIDLERLTGIEERRIADAADDSLTLAVGAAQDCLSHSRHGARDIELLVSCSITKYRDGLDQWFEPPMSLAIAQQIGASSATTFDISNACAGMLTGVFVVANRIRRGEIDCGMVVSGEYISQLGKNAAKHVRSIVSPELASLTLGDAGAAAIVERAPAGVAGISIAGFTTLSEHSRLCLAYPARHDEGARMFTKSQAIQKFAIADTPILLQEALDTAGISIGDIDWVIPHQTSARAIRKGMKEVCAALGGEPKNPAVHTVDHYGNTASTSHFVALVELLEEGAFKPAERVALIALASGIEIGVVLFTVDDELVSHYAHAA